MVNRPFEVGDMVISKRFGICYVSRITTNVVKVKSKDDDLFFGTDGRFLEYEIEPDIVTIRTPRKGSKEARDIVAMLARSYHKNIIKDWKKGNLKKKLPLKSVYKSWTVSGRNTYEKAKSMLK